MAMSKELLDDVLTSVHDDRLRRRLADALTRENTELCEVVSMLSQLSAHLKEVDSKNYVTPEPTRCVASFQDLESEMGRLILTFQELTDKVDSLISSAS